MEPAPKKAKTNEQEAEVPTRADDDHKDESKDQQPRKSKPAASEPQRDPRLFTYYVHITSLQTSKLYLSELQFYGKVCKSTLEIVKPLIEMHYRFTPPPHANRFQIYNPKRLQGIENGSITNESPVTHARFETLANIDLVPLNIIYLELGDEINAQLNFTGLSHLQTLVLGESFSHGLEGCLPPSLRDLTLNQYPSSKITFPPQLRYLELKTKSLEPLILKSIKEVTSLRELILPDDFKEDLEAICPPNLLKLNVGDNYRKVVNKNTLPSLLWELTFGKKYTHLITSLPQFLFKIIFPEDYNHPIPPLPRYLTTLELPNTETLSFAEPKPLSKQTILLIAFGLLSREEAVSVWPQRLRVLKTPILPPHSVLQNLEELVFHEYFNQPLGQYLLNLKITRLTFGDLFDQNVTGCLPSTLLYLKFGGQFKSFKINDLPNGIKTLVLGALFTRPIAKLPLHLEHLQFSHYFNSGIGHFPLNLKYLEFGKGYRVKQPLPKTLCRLIFPAFNLVYNTKKSWESFLMRFPFLTKIETDPQNNKDWEVRP